MNPRDKIRKRGEGGRVGSLLSVLPYFEEAESGFVVRDVRTVQNFHVVAVAGVREGGREGMREGGKEGVEVSG